MSIKQHITAAPRLLTIPKPQLQTQIPPLVDSNAGHQTMHLISLLGLLATATLAVSQSSNNTTGKLGDARPVRNNPVIGEVWVAKFDSPTVKGFVTAVANTVGVNYTIDVTGLPVDQGPFSTCFFFFFLTTSLKALQPGRYSLLWIELLVTNPTDHPEYHVHLRPVPSDGNCADTAGHLDSYLRGDSPPCNSAAPQTCEVGDLSGKYGTVTGPSVQKR